MIKDREYNLVTCHLWMLVFKSLSSIGSRVGEIFEAVQVYINYEYIYNDHWSFYVVLEDWWSTTIAH